MSKYSSNTSDSNLSKSSLSNDTNYDIDTVKVKWSGNKDLKEAVNQACNNKQIARCLAAFISASGVTYNIAKYIIYGALIFKMVYANQVKIAPESATAIGKAFNEMVTEVDGNSRQHARTISDFAKSIKKYKRI